VLNEFKKFFSFELDRFQLRAVEAVSEGKSILVSAPTSSGKSVIAFFAAFLALKNHCRCYYTTPIKALSNQKRQELSGLYGEQNVGLLTGDNSINSDAPVVVMTTEVLRNMLFNSPEKLNDVAYVILDEMHYLQDPYRGSVWEEVVMGLDPTVVLICLSATMSNLSQLSKWVNGVHGKAITIKETKRPIPLEVQILYQKRYSKELESAILLRESGQIDKEFLNFSKYVQKHFYTIGSADIFRITDHLKDNSLLPAIWFVFSRQKCDRYANTIFAAGITLTSPKERERIKEIVDAALDSLGFQELKDLEYERFLSLAINGIATHHAGVVSLYREIVEKLFQENLIKLVFATETLATGINMPAKSVVIDTLTKRAESAHRLLTKYEFTQMAGRAGRRGFDKRGFCLIRYSPWISTEDITYLAGSGDFQLNSSFTPTYNMVVNLLRRFDYESALSYMSGSFAAFSGKKNLKTEFKKTIDILSELGYIKNFKCQNKAVLLAGIYHEMDLLICQSMENGVFDELNPESLAALMTVFSYEKRLSKKTQGSIADYELAERFEQITDLYLMIRDKEKGRKLNLTRAPESGFVPIAYSWAKGSGLSKTLGNSGISAGEFVKTILRTADLLRQISQVAPTQNTRFQANEAIDRLIRGVVKSCLIQSPAGDIGKSNMSTS
jgi:superfamily II RNA helicase